MKRAGTRNVFFFLLGLIDSSFNMICGLKILVMSGSHSLRIILESLSLLNNAFSTVEIYCVARGYHN